MEETTENLCFDSQGIKKMTEEKEIREHLLRQEWELANRVNPFTITNWQEKPYWKEYFETN